MRGQGGWGKGCARAHQGPASLSVYCLLRQVVTLQVDVLGAEQRPLPLQHHAPCHGNQPPSTDAPTCSTDRTIPCHAHRTCAASSTITTSNLRASLTKEAEPEKDSVVHTMLASSRMAMRARSRSSLDALDACEGGLGKTAVAFVSQCWIACWAAGASRGCTRKWCSKQATSSPSHITSPPSAPPQNHPPSAPPAARLARLGAEA